MVGFSDYIEMNVFKLEFYFNFKNSGLSLSKYFL
jgi:hypothetical protein